MSHVATVERASRAAPTDHEASAAISVTYSVRSAFELAALLDVAPSTAADLLCPRGVLNSPSETAVLGWAGTQVGQGTARSRIVSRELGWPVAMLAEWARGDQ
jgi:hypothetical protein